MITQQEAMARQQQLDSALQNSTPVSCLNCGHNFFKHQYMIRKIGKLYTGNPQDTVVPFPVFVCAKCDTPISEMLPKFDQVDQQKEDPKPGGLIIGNAE